MPKHTPAKAGVGVSLASCAVPCPYEWSARGWRNRASPASQEQYLWQVHIRYQYPGVRTRPTEGPHRSCGQTTLCFGWRYCNPYILRTKSVTYSREPVTTAHRGSYTLAWGLYVRDSDSGFQVLHQISFAHRLFHWWPFDKDPAFFWVSACPPASSVSESPILAHAAPG